MKKLIIISLVALFSGFVRVDTANAQAEPFIGQLIWVPYNFCPRGWTEAGGQIMSIAQNTALFSLLGTTYGGNGQTTFGLPDLRGRVSIGQGQGPGLSPYVIGQQAGAETTTLTVSNMPSHSHQLNAVTGVAGKTTPTGNFLAASGSYRSTGNGTALSAQSVGSTGGSQPFSNIQPYLTLRPCIALEGIFPSRN